MLSIRCAGLGEVVSEIPVVVVNHEQTGAASDSCAGGGLDMNEGRHVTGLSRSQNSRRNIDRARRRSAKKVSFSLKDRLALHGARSDRTLPATCCNVVALSDHDMEDHDLQEYTWEDYQAVLAKR